MFSSIKLYTIGSAECCDPAVTLVMGSDLYPASISVQISRDIYAVIGIREDIITCFWGRFSGDLCISRVQK